MFYFKRSLLLVGLLFTVCLAACGTASTPTTTGSTNNTMSNTNKDQGTVMTGGTVQTTNATPASKGTPATGGMTPKYPAPTTTVGGGNMQGAFIKTTQVKINGKMVVVLTNAKGMILYYKLNDPHPASACTGACAQSWPPVLAQGMMTISSSMALPHKLAAYMTANGNQVEYDGHPLYTYVGDMTPGQFAGRGMGNVWYLVSTAL